MNQHFKIEDLVQIKSNLKKGRIISYKRMLHPKNKKVETAYMVRHRENTGIYFKDEIEGIHS